MGLLSGILGGGSTRVTTTQNQDVNVGVSVNPTIVADVRPDIRVDTTALAGATDRLADRLDLALERNDATARDIALANASAIATLGQSVQVGAAVDAARFEQGEKVFELGRKALAALAVLGGLFVIARAKA
jgi:hypothetical protein